LDEALFNYIGDEILNMLGFEYYPFDNVYFTIGAELHQFYYQHNNNNFINQKISFNYGLGVKL
jgi:hypothetical protein